ncbi:hypothetical protein BSKO_09230 [Bryopsis sp. KO-2023]|nr:hypothetical protein BSKO_09230 [Bryopsis sp. KO-2023]
MKRPSAFEYSCSMGESVELFRTRLSYECLGDHVEEIGGAQILCDEQPPIEKYGTSLCVEGRVLQCGGKGLWAEAPLNPAGNNLVFKRGASKALCYCY